MITVQIPAHDGQGKDYASIDKFPDHCPICHAGIEPIKRDSIHFNAATRRLENVFRCPRERCQSLFIARYSPYSSHSSSLNYCGSYPFERPDADFSEHIEQISPRFCKIQNEAQKAEQEGWKLIAGPGYRKALEFLIKDYLCIAQPENLERIKSVQLGACIANYVENEKVKAMAARAVWLGNDETHDSRKWEDKDLEDLKQLIGLTVHWIEMEAMTMSILKDMPEPKNNP